MWKKNLGEMPVERTTKVAVKLQDETITTGRASYYNWEVLDTAESICYWILKSEYDAESQTLTVRIDEGLDSRIAGIAKKPPVNVPDPGAHYRYEYKGIKLDPFRICSVYSITDLGQGTIVKKGLRLGTSIKDRKQDLLDIISAAERMLEMMEEDKE